VTKILIIEALVIIVLICIIIIVSKCCRKLQTEKTELDAELSKQKSNSVYLYKHAEELAQIKKDEKKIDKKIDGAKSDEEIYNIINSIVSANNDRVHK